MLRRVLVLLGESEPAVAARNYAFRMARDMDVELTGLAGIDPASLHVPNLARAGAAGIQVKIEEELREQAESYRQRLRDTYQRECAARGVPFEWQSFDADPDAALGLAVETRDMIITGHDTSFQPRAEQPLPETLSRLLSATPRPFIVCGPTVPEQGRVVVAYDGSVPAMRALQMFALIGLAEGQDIKVVSVDPDEEEAERSAEGAVSYLRSHGFIAEAMAVASRRSPAEVVQAEVANLGARTLVMGSYGRRGWRQVLFGSTTSKLVEKPPCALFVYH